MLVGASSLALAIGNAAAPPALAADECGVVGLGGTAACTPAGNPFPNGIEYQVFDLTIVAQDGVIIDTTGAAGEPGGIVAGGAGNYGDQVVKGGAGGGTGITITTDDADADGIHAESDTGKIAITSFGTIITSGDDARGIYGRAEPGYSVTISATGAITTSGASAQAIQAQGTKYSDVTVTSNASLSTSGNNSDAIYAAGERVVVTSNGAISTKGDGAGGIDANGLRYDSVTVTSTGAIVTEGSAATGIAASNYAGDLKITVSGAISTNGTSSYGIYAATGDYGDITIDSQADITIAGDTGAGIKARNTDGDITIESAGTITTAQISSDGIFAYSGGGIGPGGAVEITSLGDIRTSGLNSFGIAGTSLAGAVIITSEGDVSTTGKTSTAIRAAAGGLVEVTAAGTVTTLGDDAEAVLAISSGGDAGVISKGALSTAGADSSAIHARAYAGNVTVTASGGISTAGANSSAIYTKADDAVTIAVTGDIATAGSGAFGISSYAVTGATKIVSDGDITTTGGGADAIAAFGRDKDITIGAGGTLTTSGISAEAVSAYSKFGAVTITAAGDISTAGTSATGIFASAPSGGVAIESKAAIATLGTSASAISANSTSGHIAVTSRGALSTKGMSADGIFALTKTGDIVIDSTGDIATAGLAATGIQALSDDGSVTVTSAGDIVTHGNEAGGILAIGENSASITAAGAIRTSGAEAHAIQARGDDGSVLITAGTAIATGEDARGIHATSNGPAGSIQLIINGDVAGGWGSGAGIMLDAPGASEAAIAGGASVGALSDLALLATQGSLTVSNRGTITGYVQFGGDADILSNISTNSFDLRNFADTDGDGVRDTEGVAISDFGGGLDEFDNVGTLRLSNVSGATAWDASGQITHPGGGNASITQEGVEQGFLVNLESFLHSGLITMQDGVAGDLLVISDQADGATAGSNSFIGNGGRLALDVVLDDGAGGQSDVLILDKAIAGTGATRVFVANAGGVGGQTTGDGIMVVNVRTDSGADAFTLGNRPVAGAYQYDLFFQNLAGTDENWYLRSSLFEGALEYPAIATGALATWYSDLGALHERLGERRRAVEDRQTAALNTATDVADAGAVRGGDSGPSSGAGWFRVVGADLEIEQAGPSDFDLDTVRAEAGLDIGFDNIFSDDWLVLGAFAGYGWSSARFDSGADVDFDLATVGAYATYFRGPYYLDALVKFDWLDGDYRSDVVSNADVELPVIGLSLETGYRFDLTEGGLYLQPQAQLAYAHVGEDSFRDDSGAAIELEDADSLRGRLGARIGQELDASAGAAAEPVRGNFYLEASVNQEFLGDTRAMVSGLTLEQELPGTTFEIGAGFDIALPKDGVSFTIDADYIFGDDAEGLAATGGIRITW